MQVDECFLFRRKFESAKRYLAHWAARFRMVAVPIFPNICSRFTGHSSKAPLLIPFAREFQDDLLTTSRKTAGCNDSEGHPPKRQAPTTGSANTCPFGCRGLGRHVPFFAASWGVLEDEMPPLLPLIEAQIPPPQLLTNCYLIWTPVHPPGISNCSVQRRSFSRCKNN